MGRPAIGKHILIASAVQPIDDFEIGARDGAKGTDQFILDITVCRILISQRIAARATCQHSLTLQIGFGLGKYRCSGHVNAKMDLAIDMQADQSLTKGTALRADFEILIRTLSLRNKRPGKKDRGKKEKKIA